MSYFDDPIAIGPGSEVAQLRRLHHPTRIQFALTPSWGTSRLRDLTTTSNSGSVGETGGEIKVATGTDAAGSATMTSRERGQYRSGAWLEGSMGVRIPDAGSLSGSQVARFGYFDDSNGFGFGVDATGVFTFRRNDGTDTTYRPSDWHDGEITTQHLTDGLIVHVLFRWYGHGPVRWYVEPKENEYADEQEIDRQTYKTELSITDPNQPLRVEADNGGTGGSSLDVFVGGRQVALWGQGTLFNQRDTTVIERSVGISSANTWESAMAIRKKSNFNSRPTSVRAQVIQIGASASKASEVRITYDADVSSIAWTDPEDVPTSETAIETNDGTFTTDDAGVPDASMILGANQKTGPIEKASRIPIGNDTVVLVQIRSDDNSTTFDVLNLQIEEQW